MRTTLTIDDDVLHAAKAIAEQQNRSIGEVVSDLARRALRPAQAPKSRNGVPLLPRTDSKASVTLETVNALRDDLL
jgi:negative regulator of replication initiation